jgi:hypothetical protein
VTGDAHPFHPDDCADDLSRDANLSDSAAKIETGPPDAPAVGTSNSSSAKLGIDHSTRAALPYQRVMKTGCGALRLCAWRRSHRYRGKFILNVLCDRRTIVSQIPAMTPVSVQKNRRWKITMLNKLIAAAAMAAIAYTVVPANAAKVSAGCGGENLSKTESMIEAMADGEGKVVAQKEVALAQESMLSGKMGACAAHLSKAMHAGTAK